MLDPDTSDSGGGVTTMPQVLGLVSVVVRDYDEALGFHVGVLGFDLIEDTPVPETPGRAATAMLCTGPASRRGSSPGRCNSPSSSGICTAGCRSRSMFGFSSHGTDEL